MQILRKGDCIICTVSNHPVDDNQLGYTKVLFLTSKNYLIASSTRKVFLLLEDFVPTRHRVLVTDKGSIVRLWGISDTMRNIDVVSSIYPYGKSD